MRKLMVTIVALCLGLLLPMAAMPVRVCLLSEAQRAEDCCPDCATKDKDKSCCIQSDGLPDSPLPAAGVDAPVFAGYPLPPGMAELPENPEHIAPAPRVAPRQTGAGPPARCRAVLNVWRL